MKVTLHRHSQNINLTLKKEPFASGGEGNLYKIVSPLNYQNFVVKLYHEQKRTAKKESKVRFLMNNPPNLNSGGHNSLVWVEGMIYDKKGFAGLLMPFAKGEKLVILCTPKIPRKHRQKWGRFSFQTPNAVELRLKICFNIAAALYQLHETERYVLVDLKPDNVIIQPNGLVSIVDIDSMEVLDNGKVLFPAPVVTPEFAPPEYYRDVKPGKKAIMPTWDQFSMAAIFYKLLFGIHPYAGSCKPPYDNLTTLNDKIEHGFFVHSHTKSQHFRVIPPPHKRFKSLKTNIQSLFLRCFEEGHLAPENRPTPDEWCSVISGRTLLVTDRPLPSRVLSLNHVGYTPTTSIRTALSPVSASQLKPPTLPAKPMTSFNAGNVVDYVFLGIGGIFSYVVLKSFFVTILAALAVMRITYNMRQEVGKKRRLKKQLRTASTTMLKKRLKIDRLRNEIGHINKNRTSEVAAFERKQGLLLSAERQKMDDVQAKYRSYIGNQDAEALALYKAEEEEVKALMSNFKALEEGTDASFVKKVDQIQKNLNAATIHLTDMQIALKDALADRPIKNKTIAKDIQQKLDQIVEENGAAKKELKQETDNLIAEQNQNLLNMEQRFVREIEGEANRKLRLVDQKIHGLNKQIMNMHHEDYEQQVAVLRDEKYKISKEVDLKRREVVRLIDKQKEIIEQRKNDIRNDHQQKWKALEEIFKQKKKALINGTTTYLRNQISGLEQKRANLKQQLEQARSVSGVYVSEKEAFEAQREVIKQRYDALHEALVERSKTQHEQAQYQLEDIKKETEQKSNQLMTTTALIPVHTQKYMDLHQKESQQLRILNQEYAHLEQEFKSYDDITFWNYVGKILSFK